jgi:prepilin-type N-terminal cleavage/methylation domain-containing protein
MRARFPFRDIRPDMLDGHTGPARGGRGFTLAEVLVVGVIMVILAAVAIPTYSSYVSGQKQEVVENLAQTAGVSANAFYRRHGRAPTSSTEMNLYLPDEVRFVLTFPSSTTLTITDYQDSDHPISSTVTYR